MGHWEQSSWEDAAKAMILSQETCLFLNHKNCPRGLGERRMLYFLTFSPVAGTGSRVFCVEFGLSLREAMIK